MFSVGKNHLTTKDNRGLTLVELLVAVVIFSIAIVPMLYAFVYSTGYSFKAQQTLQSTGIAQAVIEKAKSPGVNMDVFESAILGNSLLDNGVFSWNSSSDDGTDALGYHHYRIEDVKALNLTEDTISRRIYDVDIAVKEGSSSNASVIRSMSDTTANFTDYSSDFTSSLLLFEDQQAEDKLVELIRTNLFTDSHVTVKDSTGAVVPSGSWPVAHPAMLLGESDIDRDTLIIRRVIYIDCTSTAVTTKVSYFCGGFYTEIPGGTRSLGSVLTISKDVNISGDTYTITCSGGINGPSDTYSIITSSNLNPSAGDKPFYKAKYNGNESFTLYSGATDALFFYYYPGYESTTSSGKANYYDSFIINNSVNAADVTGSNGIFDMYFYKQYNNTLTTAQLEQGEFNYAPYFNFTNSSTSMTINFYNNLLNDVREDDFYDGTYGLLNAHSGTFADKLQADGSSSLIAVTGNFENKTLLPTSIPGVLYDFDNSNVTPYESVVTTYSIIVTVYKDNESTPIETMSSEVINW